MSDEPSHSPPPPTGGTLLLFSNKPPEEARLFGFRGSDIQDIREPAEDEAAASPDDWGLAAPTSEGVCKYCQLMLHRDAPRVTLHQPNLQRLIASGRTCPVCGWLEVSIVRGAPDVVRRFQAGDPALCDPDSEGAGISVRREAMERYTQLVPVVGDRGHFADTGVPVMGCTTSQIGEDLMRRRFWRLTGEQHDAEPHERMSILKSWLDECLDGHEDCPLSRSAAEETPLPTRVLDLTGSPAVPSDPDEIIIRLRETSEGEKGSYAALSYCWGADAEHHFKTTEENLEAHKSRIAWTSLPLTQREAVLAALYLGIRYVWIDSLCIVQGSPEDWEAEAAKMSTVYSNALLTLAATSSSSPSEGLLHPFSAAEDVPLHGETVLVRMETHRLLDRPSEPLNTRGWTLQEAVLSPRVVSFGAEQWLWKCPGRYATEDGLVDRPQLARDSLNQWAGVVRQGAGEDGNGYFEHWYRFVSNYSRRSLTYQSDRLKAIAGLADIFAGQTGYQYIAGLWREDLTYGLLWQTTSRGAARDDTSMPSWSWISVDGPVMVPDLPRPSTTPFLELLHVDQQWEGVPLSSRLKTARLTVRGRMMELTLGKRSLTQQLRHHLVTAPDADEIAGEVFLDNTAPAEQGVSSIWCLLVNEVEAASAAEGPEKYVLVLVPAVSQGGEEEDEEDRLEAFKRIGFAVVWEKSKFSDRDDEGNNTFEKASDATVVLV